MNRFLFGQEHVDRYRATDGEEGHEWLGTQVLLLTTKGRRSGESRTVPLIYDTSGHDYLVVASKGGSHRPSSTADEGSCDQGGAQVKRSVADPLAQATNRASDLTSRFARQV